MNNRDPYEPTFSSPGSTAPEGIPEAAPPAEDQPGSDHPEHQGHRGHGWMMILCCVPMLVIVGVLVATSAASFGWIAFAVLCTAMMAIMMVAMPGGHRH